MSPLNTFRTLRTMNAFVTLIALSAALAAHMVSRPMPMFVLVAAFIVYGILILTIPFALKHCYRLDSKPTFNKVQATVMQGYSLHSLRNLTIVSTIVGICFATGVTLLKIEALLKTSYEVPWLLFLALTAAACFAALGLNILNLLHWKEIQTIIYLQEEIQDEESN